MSADAQPALVFRFCPRCGAAGLESGAGSRFSCASCRFIFYLDVAAAVAAIIRGDDDRVLLTRRAIDPQRGKLDVPGGFVEPGETAEEALHRELREELNLEIVDSKYFCSEFNTYDYGGLRYNTLDVYYTCGVHDPSLIRAADDISDYDFVLPREIDMSDVAFDSVRRVLARLVRSA
ncbi:MAG: NUDIX domain-containing protein [Vicinamibacteria bacterium]|nr:NUDIX domain-containing protein [Vicinamibacteria bacterium]